MTYEIRFTKTARRQIHEITFYLKKLGPAVANRFLENLRNQIKLLESGVIDYGKSHIKELAAVDIHSCLVGKYVLLYKVLDGTIVILNVFHGSQDYAKLFRESPCGV